MTSPAAISQTSDCGVTAQQVRCVVYCKTALFAVLIGCHNPDEMWMEANKLPVFVLFNLENVSLERDPILYHNQEMECCSEHFNLNQSHMGICDTSLIFK